MEEYQPPVRPPAFLLFCMYYLGLNPEFQSRFYNINTVAGHFGVLPERVKLWLQEYHMTPEIFSHTEFNVAAAHGRAQELTFTASRDDLVSFARAAFEKAKRTLSTYNEAHYIGDVDYDDIWGDSED